MRGKVSSVLVVSIESEDHPRLCGEKVMLLFDSVKSYGSPPPMRGKVLSSGVQIIMSRITPAYAGKRSANEVCSHLNRDHPRLCGEKQCIVSSRSPCSGSPPPMRGKAHRWIVPLSPARITPAYAGKSHPTHSGN